MQGNFTRICLLLLVFFLALILQTTLLPLLRWRGTMPDLLLVLVIFTALCYGSTAGGVVGLSVGLLEDLLGGTQLGFGALAGFLTAYLIGRLQGKVYRENLLLPIILAFGGTFIYNAVFLFGMGTSGSFPYALPIIWRAVVPEALLNTIMAAFLCRPFIRLVSGEAHREMTGYSGEMFR